jgi:hypothetical protein
LLLSFLRYLYTSRWEEKQPKDIIFKSTDIFPSSKFLTRQPKNGKFLSLKRIMLKQTASGFALYWPKGVVALARLWQHVVMKIVADHCRDNTYRTTLVRELVAYNDKNAPAENWQHVGF